MITVKEAVQRVLQETELLGHEELSVVEARGHVLAEEVRADVDMPPFHKSSMDGYALKASDTARTPAVLEVVGTIPAGTSPTLEVQAGQAAKIMTGAPLPAGADAVQKVELTTSGPDGRVTILEPVVGGTNVAKQGEIFAAGAVVASRGTFITPAVVGLLAAVGRESVQVFARPKVAVLVTGDELVPLGQKPGPGQIRNSNGYALQAQVLGCGAIPEVLGVSSDVKEVLAQKIADGLNADVLLISGGVSMGDFDLVEDVLAEHAVTMFFQKVSIKPGKPTVFGRREKSGFGDRSGSQDARDSALDQAFARLAE
ncbi:MAG: molybdopterin molybdenumtransferase MoeA, partial [Calditrichaeota bacterium]